MPNNWNYSFDELTDMLLVYGEAQHNSSAAVRLNAEMFLQ
jgi:hypothetical protein